MTPERLREILEGFDRVRILVVGDLFLDKYLMIDPALAETSLETGLEAYQVVEVRVSAGAAGTVVNNLRALGAGTVSVLSVVGEDGEGDDLLRCLRRVGADPHLLSVRERMTPTYTKPMRLVPGRPAVEMNRLDHKNRTPLPSPIEDEVLARLRERVGGVQAVVLADQVEERNSGVLTDRVRSEIARLAQAHPGLLFFADSRVRIGEFRGCTVKPNLREAVRAVDPDGRTPLTPQNAEAAARVFAARNGKPVFLTLGAQGMAVVEGGTLRHVPGIAAAGPLDPVGAGDSATAGIVAALCAGASLFEAAHVGNLVASLTVQQLGTTGTATQSDVLRRHTERAG